METFRIESTQKGRVVIVTEQDGIYSGRLYVNNGETACLQNNTTKTRAGIERWAHRVLSN